MKTYGIYIAPFPSTFMWPSRMIKEARYYDKAFCVKGKDKKDAWDYFIHDLPEKDKEILSERVYKPNYVLILDDENHQKELIEVTNLIIQDKIDKYDPFK